ncbi:type II secretion system ATPase GspE [Opitutaceae bacterium]
MFEPHAATVLALLEKIGLSSAVVVNGHRQDGLRWSTDVQPRQRSQVLTTIAGQLGCQWVDPLPASIPRDVIALLDPALARHFSVVPLACLTDGVEVALANPFDPRLTTELPRAVGRPIIAVVADPDGVHALVRRYYGEAGDRVGSPTVTESSTGGAEIEAPLPIVKAVDELLARAVRERASDLHLEVFEGEFQVRMRTDGTLARLESPTVDLAGSMISRVKVLAGLDIAESRRPQDGRIRMRSGGRAVDLRVSTLPTQVGESVVIRVLDTPAQGRRLADLGLSPSARAGIEHVLARPHGLLAVTGPTGSGKTTTLYGALDALNTADRKILTVEDPVEYEIDGITQVAIAPTAGLTFAAAVRAFLRHDPDVIMVGEIRDEATARVAVQAALTGHLVLTTLHATDSVGVIARLVDMGIEPYLIAAALQGVVAQRLVPRICEQCRERAPADEKGLRRLGLDEDTVHFQGRGCARCEQRGSQGRVGLHEWMGVDDGLRDAIAAGAGEAELRQAARDGGLVELREEAARLVRTGAATLADGLRVI